MTAVRGGGQEEPSRVHGMTKSVDPAMQVLEWEGSLLEDMPSEPSGLV